MKKPLLLSAILLASASIFAQPTIQSSDFYPTIGEAFTLNYGTYISPGAAGNNVTWDLSGLAASSTVTVSALAANPGFPGTDLTLTYSGQSSLYVDFTPTEYLIDGMFQIPSNTTITYSDPMKYYEFPMSMSGSYTDNFAATFTSSGFNFSRSGTITCEVDGYGTLITPSGTYTNVLRVHSVQDYTDSYSMGSLDVTIDNYTWIKAGFHQELAMVQTMASDVGSGSSAYYASNTLGLDNNEFSSLKLYPNPAQSNLKIDLDTPVDQIQVTDLNGRLVDVSFDKGTRMLDISQLNSGIYYVVIYSNNSSSVRKIVKQ